MMAALSSISALPLGFRRSQFRIVIPTISMFDSRPGISHKRSSFRYSISNPKFQGRRKGSCIVCASERKEAITEEMNLKEKASEARDQGPPVLTILAGLVVFLLVCWFLGSTVIWLFSLVFGRPFS